MASASSLRRDERATPSCSGGRRMAPAATSGSSRVRRDLLDLRANGWSADGRQLLFTEVSPSRQGAIGQIAIERPSDAKRAGERASSTTTMRPSLQTDAGWPSSRTCPVEPRSTSSGIRSSEIGNRSRPAAAIARSGRVTAGNCSSAAWTVGRCLPFRCSPGRRSSPGVRRCCSNSRWSQPVGGARPYDIAPDGRFLIIRSGQAEAGWRHGVEHDRRAELVRRVEASRAGQMMR